MFKRPIEDDSYISVIYAALLSLWARFRISKTEFKNLSKSVTENKDKDIEDAKKHG